MEPEGADGLLRIGELSRRTGVSDHVLRAWERRYGLLEPARSVGGFRLYSAGDEDRVRRMQAHLDRGLSAAEAARAALAAEQATDGGTAEGSQSGVADGHASLAERARSLTQALDELDEPAAQTVLDRLLADYTVETVVRDVLTPYLHELGERWGRGDVTVGQEHFATNVLRGRLAGLARGWGYGHGPRAVLACPPGESHDLALLIFGIALHRNGWRIGYLGADTPLEELINTAADISADLVVLAATTPDRFVGLSADLTRLATGPGRTHRSEIAAKLIGELATLRPSQAVWPRWRPASRPWSALQIRQPHLTWPTSAPGGRRGSRFESTGYAAGRSALPGPAKHFRAL